MPSVTTDLTVEILSDRDLLNYTIDQGFTYQAIEQQVNGYLQGLQLAPGSTAEYEQIWANECSRILQDNGYSVNFNGNGNWNVSAYPNVAQLNKVNPADSNLSTISRGSVRNAYGNIAQYDPQTGNKFMQITRYPASGGLGAKAGYLLGSVNGAVMAAGAGIQLGKTLAQSLYDANPDYWNSIGAETLDPSTWNNITNGDDSVFAKMFNFILGIDGNNGQMQAYVDENAFAYMAYLLKQNGWFASDEQSINPDGSHPLYVYDGPITISTTASREYYVRIWLPSNNENMRSIPLISSNHNVGGMFYFLRSTEEPSTFNWGTKYSYRLSTSSCNLSYGSMDPISIIAPPAVVVHESDGYYYSYYADSSNFGGTPTSGVFCGIYQHSAELLPTCYPNGVYWSRQGYIKSIFDGTYTAPEGVGNQQGATLPDVSNWNDVPSTLSALQQQYPDMFQNPMIWNTDTPNGNTTGNTTRYIPITLPVASSATDTQPVSGTQLQGQTQILDSPQTISELAAKTVQQTSPSEEPAPPQNPIDVGTGTSPAPVSPSGSASALWSVYHPSQAQVNAFGAWLWTDNIITQIQQVLQNPMEGIITLHKVFATPIDAGNGTIVVGRLDSEVPSALVTQQYVEVDCGYVDCHEDFGCVFDYSPFTKVSLYLPFIGIVPLNVDEVMRSTLHVIYGVDVFTGACLARVEVTRDANAVNLYQYAGVASVEYPLTGSVHSGLLSGIIGAASGAIGIGLAATGAGMAAGAAAMVGGFSSAIKSSNAHSGAFSGNAGAMGIKKPYLILERPQTKIAETFPVLDGRPTNYSVRLGDCSNHVVCKTVHVSGISATRAELELIESLLKEGVEI